MQEVYRIEVTEAVKWRLHNTSLSEALRDAAVINSDWLQEMKTRWEEAGHDFYSTFHLDIRVEGDEFVVILVDEDGGVPRRCVSCGEIISPDDHSHECIVCGATLCNLCATASARCPDCTGEEEQSSC